MDASESDLGSLICLIRRRWRLIILVCTVVTLISGLATLLIAPRYTGSALIMVDASRASLLAPSAVATSAQDHARIDSEVEILRSDRVLLEVIAALGLPEDQALTRMRQATRIQREGLTYLISISVRAQSPDRAAEIANSLAETYIRVQVRDKIEDLADTAAAVSSGLEEARTALIEAERRQLAHLAQSTAIAPEMSSPGFELAQATERARTHYQTLLARSGDLAVEARMQIPHSRIISRAIAPGRPSSPGPEMIMTLASMVGVILGLIAAAAREHLSGGFTSWTQLSRMTRTPSLGHVPFERSGGNHSSVANLMVEAPLSPYAESIRRIRAGVDIHLHDADAQDGPTHARGRVIMVSSSISDEGKTAVSLSLARAYAAAGKKTLLIDCDLHHPSVHQHLDIHPQIGLLDYLVGRDHQTSLAPMIVIDADTGLTVLLGSRAADVPTDQLLNSPSFDRLMRAAVANFDVVILDSPPLLPVADGFLLARHADAVLFIVRWSSTAQSVVREAIGQLASARQLARPVLTILNAQTNTPKAYENWYGAHARG